MSEFDDPDLSGEIGRLAGPAPDAGVAFATVSGRVRRARRRRAAAWSSGAMAAVALIAVALSFSGGASRLETVPATQPGISTPESTDTTMPSSIVPPDSAVTTSSVAGTSTTVAGSTPTSRPPSTTAPSTTATSTPSTAPSSSDPVSTQPPVTSTFSCAGGSATVRSQGAAVTLLTTVPNSGWVVAETGGDDDEVDVRFEQGELESRLRVGLLGDTMVPSCEERSDG